MIQAPRGMIHMLIKIVLQIIGIILTLIFYFGHSSRRIALIDFGTVEAAWRKQTLSNRQCDQRCRQAAIDYHA